MSSVPPPVQQSNDRCPNCGAYRPVGQGYCANCGWGKPVGAANSGAQIVWIVLFIVIGLPSACLGGCLLLIGMSSPPNSEDWAFWLIMLAAIGVAVGLLVAMIMAFRKRR